MSRSSKPISFVLGGVAALVILVVAATTLLLRVNAKSRVEAAASNALEMDVKVVGRTAIGFFPSVHIALEDVHAHKQGADVASAGEVNLGIEILPLLHREVRIKNIAVKRLRIALEKGRDGKLNVERSSAVKGALAELSIAKASISDATLTYVNRLSGNTLEAANCSLDVSRLLRSVKSAAFLNNLLFAAQLACGRIRTEDFTASDVKLSVDGKNGVFNFAPVTMSLLGGHGSGSVRVDVSGSVPTYHVRYDLAQLRIEEFFKAFSSKQLGAGSMDFATKLSLRGKTTDALKRSVEGEASLHGEDLRLAIGDLDKKFARYESSQSFNLVDVGAFFFIGPLGVGITKGYDFARIFEGSEGSTTISTLVSGWQIEHGVAHATDVAMATPKNRVALKGGLDFVIGRYDDVTVALIDTKGCARVQQKIHGPFRQPQVEKPNVLRALAGPTAKLLRQAKDLFGGSCEVFYAGSVVAP